MDFVLLLWIPLVFAMATTWLFTFRVIRFAHQREVLDHPDPRKIHKDPLALLGGLGVLVGFLVGLVSLMPVLGGIHISGVVQHPGDPEEALTVYRTLGIVIGGTLVFILGLFDDLYHLRPSSKALGQLAICVVVLCFGLSWDFVSNPFGPNALENMPWLRLLFRDDQGGLLVFHGYLNIFLTILWLMGCMNAINLSDGLDGLASGTTLIAGAAFLFLASLSDQHVAALLAAAMCGAALGFLPHNFPKAKIILGDAGSLLFGFLLGAIAIEGAYKTAAGLTLLLPFLILGVPIFDTTWAMIRRSLSGQPIGVPDKNHIHHQLLRRGLTPNQATLLLWSCTAALACVAIWVAGH
ncbi:MAG: putative undecaprenyl-phosphate N-acetylglucosaminyl 1-phosphate transferase [bacterium]|nr:putative undecaprenyl-phosphate N-acetylglucosaminyl 1-phosphate transferase [bacterium]